MKKIFFLFTFLLMFSFVAAQDFSKLSTANFEVAADYQKAEGQVLECSEYLLSNPVFKDELNRNIAFQYLFKWMEGTPDYTFSLDSKVMDLTKGSDKLLTLYFASMVKTVLDSPDSNLSDEDIHQKSTEHLVTYCANEANGLKPNKPIKKLIKQRSR